MIKKIAIAAAGAMAVAGAQAANVTISGTIDTYLEVYNVDGQNISRMSSGGVSGSGIVLRGTEDIGDGLQAWFTLDNGIFSDTGEFLDSSLMFQREASVGLKGVFGKIGFGRQYTPHFLTFVMNSAANMSLGSAMGPFAAPGRVSVNGIGPSGAGAPSATTRRDNSVSYESPSFGGAKLMLFASLGEEADKNTNEVSFNRGNMYNAAVFYTAGKLRAHASAAVMNTTTLKSGELKDRTWFYTLAGSYDFGVTKASLIWTARQSSTNTAANPDLWAAELATCTPVGPGQIVASVGGLHNQSEKDADAFSWGLRYQQNLSKRTRVYVGVTGVQNDDNANFTLSGGGGSTRAPAQASAVKGEANTTVFAGMTHRF